MSDNGATNLEEDNRKGSSSGEQTRSSSSTESSTSKSKSSSDKANKKHSREHRRPRRSRNTSSDSSRSQRSSSRSPKSRGGSLGSNKSASPSSPPKSNRGASPVAKTRRSPKITNEGNIVPPVPANTPVVSQRIEPLDLRADAVSINSVNSKRDQVASVSEDLESLKLKSGERERKTSSSSRHLSTPFAVPTNTPVGSQRLLRLNKTGNAKETNKGAPRPSLDESDQESTGRSRNGSVSSIFDAIARKSSLRSSVGLRTKYLPAKSTSRTRPPTLPRRPARHNDDESESQESFQQQHTRAISAVSGLKALQHSVLSIFAKDNPESDEPKPEGLGDQGKPLTQKHSTLGPLRSPVSNLKRPGLQPRTPSVVSSSRRQSATSSRRLSNVRHSRPLSSALKALGTSLISPVRFRDSAAEELNQYETDVDVPEPEAGTSASLGRYSWGSYNSAGSFHRRMGNSDGQEKHHERVTSTASILAEKIDNYLPSNNAMRSQRMSRMLPQDHAGARQSQMGVSVVSGMSYGAPLVEVKPLFSIGVIFVLVVMFVVEMVVNGGFESPEVNPTLGPSAETMLKLGAKKTDLIVENGEWYRLVLPMLLHSGIVHLAFNLIGMFQIVIPAEVEFGHLKIAVIFILSGFFGEVMSALFVPSSVGVGASGAIFGLFGACWSDLIQNWGLYGEAAPSTARRLFFLTVINAIFGIVPLIDNFAHMGGLLFGFVAGLALLVEKRYTSRGTLKRRKSYSVFLQLVALLLLPVMIVAPLVLLANGVAGDEVCDWCSLISCVPTPFWDCTTCTTSERKPTGRKINDEAMVLFCPLGNNFTLPHEGLLSQVDVLQYCLQNCD